MSGKKKKIKKKNRHFPTNAHCLNHNRIYKLRITDQVAGQEHDGQVLGGVHAGRQQLTRADTRVEQEQRRANAVARERRDGSERARQLGPGAGVGRTQHDGHARTRIFVGGPRTLRPRMLRPRRLRRRRRCLDSNDRFGLLGRRRGLFGRRRRRGLFGRRRRRGPFGRRRRTASPSFRIGRGTRHFDFWKRIPIVVLCVLYAVVRSVEEFLIRGKNGVKSGKKKYNENRPRAVRGETKYERNYVEKKKKSRAKRLFIYIYIYMYTKMRLFARNNNNSWNECYYENIITRPFPRCRLDDVLRRLSLPYRRALFVARQFARLFTDD